MEYLPFFAEKSGIVTLSRSLATPGATVKQPFDRMMADLYQNWVFAHSERWHPYPLASCTETPQACALHCVALSNCVCSAQYLQGA